MSLSGEGSSWKERAAELLAQDRARRRREIALIVIFVIIFGVAFFLEFHLSRVAQSQLELPFISSTLFFALWNIIILLGLVVIFLAVRNLVKLIFERRRGIFGAHLRTQLVVAFMFLSILPGGILFGFSIYFISSSIERWFDPAVVSVFDSSKNVVDNTYQMVGENMLHYARQLSWQITEDRLLSGGEFEDFKKFVEQKQKEYPLDEIAVYSGQAEEVYRTSGEKVLAEKPKASVLEKALGGYEGYFPESSGEGDLVRGVMPIWSSWEQKGCSRRANWT